MKMEGTTNLVRFQETEPEYYEAVEYAPSQWSEILHGIELRRIAREIESEIEIMYSFRRQIKAGIKIQLIENQ